MRHVTWRYKEMREEVIMKEMGVIRRIGAQNKHL